MQTAPAIARTTGERIGPKSGERRTALLALLVLTFTGCGVPSSVAKQSEDLASIAAEGELLADDAADGDSTSPFVSTHASVLMRRP
jgi:hypothetical protein